MTHLVVLEFDDDEAARRFVDHMGNRSGATALNQASIAMAYSDLKYVFKIPTKFCECNVPNSAPKGTYGLGKKYGWWVHKKCGRPAKRPWGTERGVRQLLFSARNLVDDIRNRDRKES